MAIRRDVAGLLAVAGTLAALLAMLALVASPVSAAAVEVSTSGTPVQGDPGSTVVLASAPVEGKLQGRRCNATIQVTNQVSENPGNTLIVSSGSTQIAVAGIEDVANSSSSSGGSLTLGSTLDLSVRLGNAHITSVDVSVSCEIVPDPPTTTTSTKPTSVPTKPTVLPESTVPDKTSIPVECSPGEVVEGDEIEISGGRTDGFGFRPEDRLQVTVGNDVLAETTAGADGLFSVSFAVDLEPGAYRFEVDNGLGAIGGADCTVLAGPPAISVRPEMGEVGSPVVVAGTGFQDGDIVAVTFGGESLAEGIVVDEDGTFSADGLVPDVDSGKQPIAATRADDPQAESINFEVMPPPQPVIEVSPQQGQSGASIAVRGSDYTPGDVVDISFGGEPFAEGVAVDGDGTFVAEGVVPEADDGPAVIEATRGKEPEAEAASFEVMQGLTPVIAVSPSSGEAGSPVTVSGSKYRPGDVVDISFGGQEFASGISVDGAGTFSVERVVPELDDGRQVVIALRNNEPEADQASYNVTAVPPPVCWEFLGICWWWWLLILLLLLFGLWLILWLMCRYRYPFEVGHRINGTTWIAEDGDCVMRGGKAEPSNKDGCPDGCSCQLFRRKMFGSDGCWEAVSSRQERFTYCYRAACAREESTSDAGPSQEGSSQ